MVAVKRIGGFRVKSWPPAREEAVRWWVGGDA